MTAPPAPPAPPPAAPAPPPVHVTPPPRRRRVLRPVVTGIGTGLGIAFAVVFWVSSNVGPAPEQADVCREVPIPAMEAQKFGVTTATVCDGIDTHLGLPLGGLDGFEGVFAKPLPPSDPSEPRPAYLVWESDGCSAPVLGSGPFDFSLACNRHDFGWRNLKAVDGPDTPVWHVANKDRVDAGFLYDMRLRCSAMPVFWRIGCDTTARVYYTAIRLNPSGVAGLPGRQG